MKVMAQTPFSELIIGKLNQGQFKLLWLPIISIIVLHSAGIWALFAFPYSKNLKLLAWIVNANAMGVTAGIHRLWSHRTYKATLPLKIFLMLCFCLSAQKSICTWAKQHRVHHKYSDTDADPHNSNRGFFFSHVGWLMMEEHSAVTKKKDETDISDLLEDPVVSYHQKYYYALTFGMHAITTIMPSILWGQDLFWSIFMVCIVRLCLTLNISWSINSIAHTWGNKPYNKDILPSENAIVSIAAFGEGWHNYHHTFPWDYRTGELGNYNFTTAFLELCSKLGLAYDFKMASEELIRRTIENKGDGTHKVGQHVKSEVVEEYSN